ncbi:MAG TPA: hypothetical protein VE178_01040, partial [Silvibacterium sp.]|nr:hypothetical protein [Silvibacterium sp.]
MSTPPRLDSSQLASELAKLPDFSTATGVELNALRIALARAVASGQDADQLASALNAPAGWQSVNFSQPPIPGKPGTTQQPPATTDAATITVTGGDSTRHLFAATVQATPPEWIATVAPIALNKNIASRAVVLDHEPTALGGLELPSWARALSPAAIFGPVSATSDLLQTTSTKWIIIFHFVVESVQFVRGSTVLCVLPILSSVSGSHADAALSSGSAWLAAPQFVSTAPSDGFAGIAIQAGQLSCDQPLTFGGTTVTVPASASLVLNLVPATMAAGPAGFPTQVTQPNRITAKFPASGTASIGASRSTAVLYGETIEATPANVAALYNAELFLLYIPGISSAAHFKPKPVAGKLLEFAGSAPIETAGWALSVSEATPSTLGTASGPGDFAILFGAGISCRWKGITRNEPALIGALVAQNAGLLFSVLSGSPAGVVIEQKFNLWDDQGTNNKRRCQLIAGRVAGQQLTYALTAHSEIVTYVAVLDALVDRPILATGARIPAVFLSGTVSLIHNGANYRLLVFSDTPDPEVLPGSPPAAYPMALDNALLDVSVPLAIFIDAVTDANFGAGEGLALILFTYLLIELYLPDPYTGGFSSGQDQGFVVAGYLLAEIGWTKPDKAVMRLIDLAHPHPAAPPTTEAGSTPVPPLEFIIPFPEHPIPIELATERALVPGSAAAPAAVAPESVAP